jgi:Fe-S-cluster containining protein
MPELKFELNIGEKTMNASVNLPDQAIRPVDLLPIIQGFSNAVISMAIDQDQPVSCKAGCGACCRQLVPISETEAVYLAGVIDEMPDERRAAVLGRFKDAVERMRNAGLVERLEALPLDDAAVRHQVGMDYFRLGLACPFLENESCSIHEYRPVSCREYLVTSPPEYCSAPSEETIRMVPMPARLSYVLYRFGDGVGKAPVKIMALPLLLEYQAEEQPRLPAPELFQNFFHQLTGRNG